MGDEPNAEQIRYWNEQAGPRWVAAERLMDAQIAPFGLRAMDSAGIAAGERVLDVGCGCGHTTLELARRVGSAGSALGLDISSVMLDRARQRARAEHLTNVDFSLADAQTCPLEAASFDVVFSRFGVMFFVEPRAAFANLLSALRPAGRLAFVCWQALAENPWMLVPLSAAAQQIQLAPPPAPDAPGPFSFADAIRVRGILSGAGFDAIALEELRLPLVIAGGGDLAQAVELMLQIGPAATALREAGPEARAAVAAVVRDALAPYQTVRGVELPATAWVVTARRP